MDLRTWSGILPCLFGDERALLWAGTGARDALQEKLGEPLGEITEELVERVLHQVGPAQLGLTEKQSQVKAPSSSRLAPDTLHPRTPACVSPSPAEISVLRWR